jgi:hypothetical protein
LQEFNLKRDLENIFFISFDNASNNIKSIDYFTRSLIPIMDVKMFHQKCVFHILHLIIKADIKTQNLRLRTNEKENRVNSLLEEMFNIYNSRRNTNNPFSTGCNIRYKF